jgi:hypothetical protein
LRHQPRTGRVHRQMQATDHRTDRYVQDHLGDAEHPLDRRVAAARDQHQSEAANVDHQRLLGDGAQPEQHPGQGRQHRAAHPTDVVGVQVGDHHRVQVAEVDVEAAGVAGQRRPLTAAGEAGVGVYGAG